jgi:hypothetical protein
MTMQHEYAPAPHDRSAAWVGWIAFAAVVMGTIGALNVIQGLAAIFRDEAYWVTLGGSVLAFDVSAWGWIHLVFGVLLVLIGLLLMRGSMFARVLGVLIVSLNVIAQFSWATLYPFWSLIAIGLGIVVIYALVMHGGALKPV